ncbi:MAG TPA: cupin domain-containing protein [Verrucomicrobiae bacterium]|nr:cupin domain-containing protein [Verrucomicrobiae bacterium]
MLLRRVELESDFLVLAGNARGQAAEMVIPPGGAEGGAENRHPCSDQWLFVVEGEGEAVVSGTSSPLAAGSLLLIERGETHEVRNTGSTPLRTLNFYIPPAYDAEGEELPC